MEIRQIYSLEQQMVPRLEGQTALYDWLKLKKIHRRWIKDMVGQTVPFVRANAGVTDYWVLGLPGAGKEMLSGHLIHQQQEDPYIRTLIDPYERENGEITYQYVNTPMANKRGTDLGYIQSPIGFYGQDDIAGSNRAMLEMLEQSLDEVPRPATRVIEAVVHGYPYVNFGVSPLEQALKRAKYDPNYRVNVIYLVPEPALTEHIIESREAVAQADTDEMAEEALKERGVNVDVPILGRRDQVNKSWGNRAAMVKVRDAGDKHLLRIQSEIRSHHLCYLPKSKTGIEERDLKDPHIWMRYHVARAAYLGIYEFGASSWVVRENKKIPEHLLPEEGMNFYRSINEKYGMYPLW